MIRILQLVRHKIKKRILQILNIYLNFDSFFTDHSTKNKGTGHKLKTVQNHFEKPPKSDGKKTQATETTQSTTTSATPFQNSKVQRTPLANLQIPRSESSRSLNTVSEEFIERAMERAISKAFLPIQHWMTRNDTRMERLENILMPLDPEEELEANINIACVEDVQKFERDLMTPEYRKQIVSTIL